MAGEASTAAAVVAPAPSRWQRFVSGARAVVASPFFHLFGIPLLGLLLGAACHVLPPKVQPVCEEAVALAQKALSTVGSGGEGGGGGAAAPASLQQQQRGEVDCGPGSVEDCSDPSRCFCVEPDAGS